MCPSRITVTFSSSLALFRMSNFLFALISKTKPTVVASITATKMPKGSSSTLAVAVPVKYW